MTNTCPACNKAVDPLRSRFVAVRGGKVVAYCSAGCAQAQGAGTPPVSSHVSPATGVPTAIPTPPSGIPAHTPAAGVAARRTPAGGVPLGPPVPATPAPGVPISLESGPVIEILHEPASGVVTSARDERTEPRAKHPDEIPIAAFWSADKESGAVRAISDPGSDAVKASTERSDRGARDDTTLSKWATEETADLRRPRRELSDPGDFEDALPRRGGRLRIAILLLILLGAGGFLVYQYLVKPGLAAATRVPPPPAAAPAAARAATPMPPKPPESPAVDVSAAVGQARSTLEADLAAPSQRLQRLAAAALARTQHPAARTLLATQMAQSGASELSEIARLDLAYSLARGGDKRGGDALAVALRSSRAEVRDEAARLLALLGDRRAVSHLTDVLAVTQRRLGAAEHLAHLDDPHAIKVLDQIWTDPASSANDKARAAIALAIAGRRDVAPDLRAMLADPHFNAFAAAALAELRDRAAQPVLVHQLESPALVVRAARALRRLDPALDPRAVLPHLLDVLKSGRDTDQVQAAEAILLLAGPETLSTYD
jgi:hypothetical protein